MYNYFFLGGANKDKIKKAIFPDSQSFVNLKSNTMKNTVQIYENSLTYGWISQE